MTDRAAPAVERAGEAAEPLAEEVAPAIEKTGEVAEPVAPVTGSILKEATPVTKPVLEAAPVAGEPVLEKVDAVVEAASPVADPALQQAIPTGQPHLQEATPAAEPVRDGVGPLSESDLVAAAPVTEPLLETDPPVVGSAYAKEVAQGNSELSLLPTADILSSAISSPSALREAEEGASLDPLPAPASLVNVESTRGVEGTSSLRPAQQAQAMIGPIGAYPRPFDDLLIDRHPAILGPAAAKSAPDRAPRPFPFEFPSNAPPAASSFGGSSSSGIGLELLGVLGLALILARMGLSSRSPPEDFKLSSSLRPAIERPG